MPTQVRLPTGEEIEVDMEYCKTTIDDIEKEIEGEYPAYPVASQIVSFDEEELVDGSKTLEQMNYSKDRYLVLNLKSCLTIYHVGPAPIFLKFEELEEIADLRRRWH